MTPYAKTIAYHLLRNPLNQSLPRKFKIALSGCKQDCALTPIHDVGLLAAKRADGTIEMDPQIKQIVETFAAAYRDVAAEFERLFTSLFPGGEPIHVPTLLGLVVGFSGAVDGDGA